MTFGCWAEEIIYLALPFDSDQCEHMGDLITRLGYSEKAQSLGLSLDDMVDAADRLCRSIEGQYLVTRFEVDEEWFLARTAAERLLQLQFV